MPESNIDRFRKLIAELFMLDQGDLDFGIYRIMNMKRGEITRFLDNDLIPQVRLTLGELQSGNRTEIQADLDNAIEQARQLGVDPEASPRVKELREKLSAEPDIAAIENEVFSSLFNFFRRYYQSGDFLSLRRYKEGVYAIPYEGEEVKLHWSNADQYYIKTAENFRDYTFKLPSGLFGSDKRVHFKVVEADTERDNIKAAAGQERRFILCEESPIAIEGDELVIRFEYRPDAAKRKQKDINTATLETILNTQDSACQPWIIAIGEKAPTESNPSRTILEKHLTDYTARNTFDYFIHKDLGGFLYRELDFFIKNEIMHLDDIESETAPRVEQYLAKVRAIRRIAHKIIDMLAQLENFQKKLWIKKKFVVETNYCVTLDHVPEDLYQEIVKNAAQIEEWTRLFAIDEIKGDLVNPGYAKKLKPEFLKANPHLVIDTKFFDEEFKDKILTSMESIDCTMDGLLVHSENFHALNLMIKKYKDSISCTYIDPPFNLQQNADFLYKTDYKDSTWASFLFDRIMIGKMLLADDGVFYIRCDDHGNYLVRMIGDMIFGTDQFQYELSVQRIRKNVTNQGKISMPLANDSLFLYYKTEKGTLIDPFLKLSSKRESYWRRIDDSAGYRNPPERTIFGQVFTPYKHDAHFKFSQTTMDKMILDRRIRLRCNSCGNEHYEGTWTHCSKCNKKEATPQYLVEETDQKVLDTNWMDISGYSSSWGFSTENSETLLERSLKVGSRSGEIVMDFFAGSGTTLAVAQKMRRKWIGIEMGVHFDTITMRRLKTVLHDGKSGAFKYIRLESYEDAVNNLELKRTEAQTSLLDGNAALREDYTLRYMLDVESGGSASLLNIGKFDDPFNYTMNISTGTAGESKPAAVDLVETFNYLIGLRVEHIDHIRGFRVIQGRNPSGEKVLAIWRNTREKSSEDLDAFFQAQNYNTRDYEFDIIYVNGDNNLENLRREDETWKVRLIEEEFHRLMFDVKDV